MKTIIPTFLALSLCACSSIQGIGTIGPNHLKVYSIKDSDFLSANRMLVILNKQGDVAAYSGGTVAGLGSVGMQTGGTVLAAGATVVGAKAIQHGLENAKVNVKGIPDNYNVNLKADQIK